MTAAFDPLRVDVSEDAAAKAARAKRLLSEPPYSVDEGVALTHAAAREGNGEAAHMAAILSASGAGVAQDWTTALDHLQRAAELGHSLAQGQIAILGGDTNTHGPDAGHWRRLRQGIDIAAFTQVPRPRPESSVPRISTIEGFLPASFCDWLIARARPLLKRASVRIAKSQDADSQYTESRTNSDASFGLFDGDVIMHLVQARIAAATGLPTAAMEPFTVLHYSPGEQFFPHFDYFDGKNAALAREIAERGQRIVTFLAYLNEGYEGGETVFPTAGWRFKGATGNGMFFWNVSPYGQTDWRTLHAGLPTTRGEKWLLSQWIRGRV